MMNINNPKIGARLGLGFGVILLMLAVIAGLSMVGMSKIQEDFDFNVNVAKVKVDTLHELRYATMSAIVAGRNIALLSDPADIDRENQKLTAVRSEYGRLFNQLNQLATPDEKLLLDKVSIARQSAVDMQNKAAAEQLANGKDAAMKIIITEVQPLQTQTLVAMRDLIEFIGAGVANSNANTAKTLAAAQLSTWSIAGVACLLSSLIAWWVTRSIVQPLAVAVNVADRVASGDLSGVISVNSTDEAGKLLNALIGAVSVRGGHPGWRGGRTSGRHHGLDQYVVKKDIRHHWRYRWHRISNQYSGFECSGRSAVIERIGRKSGPVLSGFKVDRQLQTLSAPERHSTALTLS